MEKSIKVILLPAEKISYIGICIKEMSDVNIGELKTFSSPMLMSLEYWQPQHIYITVSQDVEPIKEGDWFISELGQLWQHNGKVQPSKLARKIIVSDDPKLLKSAASNYTRDRGVWGCYRVQQSFLKEFVANPDGEYFVEYEIDKYDERNQYQDVPSGKYWEDEPIPKSPDNLYTNAKYFKLKLNQDNTVNITSVGNSLKQELIKHLESNHIEASQNRVKSTIVDWIKEYL